MGHSRLLLRSFESLELQLKQCRWLPRHAP